jgi:arylsulfatase A-like enzyme
MSSLNRRVFLGALGAGAAAALPGCAQAQRSGEGRAGPPAHPPNVLFIITDDQRYDTLHALGNEIIRTPAMDSLVAGGTAFTNPYIQGGTGGAICISSRAMILTGRSLWRAPNDCKGFPLWPEVFKEAGYATWGVGKWHNGPASYARCFTGGGTIFFGGMTDQAKVTVHDFNPEGKYPKKAERTESTFSSELFSDTAVRFLREHQDPKPFFMWLAYTAPHDPRTAPLPYDTMYDPAQLPMPKNFLPEHPWDNGDVRGRDEMLAPFPRTPEVVRKHLADYYACISYVDSQIGRVLAALKEAGHADDTIVVFAGDNGLALGQHGLFGKQSVYEHSVRVPLVMAGPGVPAGARQAGFAYTFDIFPTVCDLAGVAAPKRVDGKSFAPVFAGCAKEVRDGVCAAYRDFQRMVRDERYKLIKYSVKGEKHTQLFDLAADPWETKNLVEDPACAKPLAALEARMKRCLKEAGDKAVM